MKLFKEYIKDGVIIRQRIDKPRADSLHTEAEKRKKFLDTMQEKIPLSDDSANYFIEMSYDLIMELIRSKLLLSGFRSSGKNSHEAEISFLQELKFQEKDIRFADELRHYRNKILYDGKHLDKEYANKVLEFQERMYKKLI